MRVIATLEGFSMRSGFCVGGLKKLSMVSIAVDWYRRDSSNLADRARDSAEGGGRFTFERIRARVWVDAMGVVYTLDLIDDGLYWLKRWRPY